MKNTSSLEDLPRRELTQSSLFHSRMKVSGANSVVVPIKNGVKHDNKVDAMVALRSQISDLLDVDGILFWGASINDS